MNGPQIGSTLPTTPFSWYALVKKNLFLETFTSPFQHQGMNSVLNKTVSVRKSFKQSTRRYNRQVGADYQKFKIIDEITIRE